MERWLAFLMSVCAAFGTAIWTTGERAFLNGKSVGIAQTATQLGSAGVGEAIVRPDDNWGIADGSTIYPRQIYDLEFRIVEDFGFVHPTWSLALSCIAAVGNAAAYPKRLSSITQFPWASRIH